MIINSLEVAMKSQNQSTVKFAYDVHATLSATDEAAAKWKLHVSIHTLGMETFNNHPIIFSKAFQGDAGTPLTPTGKHQGDQWTAHFEQDYQKNTIAMSGNEINVIFEGRLIPVLDVNPSNTVTTVTNFQM